MSRSRADSPASRINRPPARTKSPRAVETSNCLPAVRFVARAGRSAARSTAPARAVHKASRDANQTVSSAAVTCSASPAPASFVHAVPLKEETPPSPAAHTVPAAPRATDRVSPALCTVRTSCANRPTWRPWPQSIPGARHKTIPNHRMTWLLSHRAPERRRAALPFGLAAIAALGPVIPIEAAILHRFRDVLCAHPSRSAQIGDGARDFQNAIVRAGGKSHPADGHFERSLARVVERANFSNAGRWHPGIVEAAGLLDRARLQDAPSDIGGGFGIGIGPQLLERDRRHFDVDIDAVQQGTADLAEVLLDLPRRAAALARGVAVEAALAPVQIAIGVWRRST